MAGAVISSIIGKVLSFRNSFQFSYHDRRDVEADLLKLMITLERIKATLMDAEEREIRDRSVKLWLKELKRVAYAAEDILDEYQYEILRTRVEQSNGSKVCHGLMQLEVSSVHLSRISIISPHMVQRISEIRTKFDEIAKDRDALCLRKDDGVRRPQFGRLMPPPTSHFVDESSVFGRKKEKEHLVNLLLSDECSEFNPLSVISIVGKGGLGKTTLAQIAFNDSRISGRFDLIGWVSVLEDSDVKGLTQAIFESITGCCCDLMELSALQKKLGEEVRGKHVLIVLDDVWSEDRRYWESLGGPLKMAKMARVLVTTRNLTVSRIMQSVCQFPLGYLSEEQSWLLFKHHAFGSSTYNHETNFTLIGKQIVKKCGGLPLAIKSVASLLRHEENYDGWEEILECAFWELNAKNEIFPALEISYARMPAHLKPCFLFCSLYPKDYIFKKDQLIGLWIAQGYVEPEVRRTLEETGWGYLEELVQRSFIDYSSILPSDTDLSGEANKVLKLHSVMHDLARFISENEHVSLDGGPTHNLRTEFYHLYTNDYKGLINPLVSRSLPYLRTVILDFNNEDNPQINELTKAVGLRAFGLHGGGRKTEIPDWIGTLKHLRYLCFSSCNFEMLPESICLLYNLQILTINNCPKLACLPRCIENLVSLRYLDIRYLEIKNLPDSFTLLNNLQTLIFCSLKESELPKELGNLVNLRKLVLNGCSLENLPESICRLNCLQSLSLSNCISLKELPVGLESLKKLRVLDLNGSGIEQMTSSIYKLTLLERLNASLKLKGDNVNDTIGLLEDLVNLNGNLCFTGLRRITNLTDASRANLQNKKNITDLTLSWWTNILTKSEGLTLTITGVDDEDEVDDDEDNVGVDDEVFFQKLGRSCQVCVDDDDDDYDDDDDDDDEHNVDIDGYNDVDFSFLKKLQRHQRLEKYSDVDFSLLEVLRPHERLKNLTIVGYQSYTLPVWLGDASACASIEMITIRNSYFLKSFNFGTLPSLKRLSITRCHELQFLPQQTFPRKLEYLHIQKCLGLKSLAGLQKFNSLTELYISECKNLVSIEGLPCTISVLLIHECKNLRSFVQSRISSLKLLEISKCPRLKILMDELGPLENCVVRISDCPILQEWCQKSCIEYLTDCNSGQAN